MFDSDKQTENDARLNLLYEIGRVLASAERMAEAAPQILEAICRNLHFELGELWRVAGEENFLKLKYVWHSPSPELENFAAESRQFEFPAGDGLPGKVWAKNAPVWLENISLEDKMPRKNFIEQIAMQSAVAFPILLSGKFLGVFTFFCRESCPHDEDLLKMFATVGNHIGQFIKRERTESNLRESDDRYRAFVRQSTEGIWRFEFDEKIPINLPVDEQVKRAFRDGYLAECNDAMARMYGLMRAEELVGNRVSDLLDMTDTANVEYLRAFFESGYSLIDAQSHEKDANGNDIFFLNSLVGTIEKSNLVRIWGTQRNITEQKKAERAVLASEESYRIVAETASDAIIKIDAQSRVLFVNHSFERIFGYEVKEVIGQSLTMIMPEDLRELHRAGFHRYLETGKRHLSWEGIEIPARHKDGHTFPLEISFGEYNQNGERFFIGIARDITERKRAEETLLEREKLAILNSDVSLAIIQSNSLPEILQACAAKIVEHLDAAFARVWTLNEKENVLELQASAGIYTHLDGAHSRVPVGQFKIGLIAEERRPHLTNAVVGDERVGNQEWAEREKMISFAGYPLIVGERLVGVVAMFARRTLGLAAVKALESAANIIALNIDRKRAEEALLKAERKAVEDYQELLERIVPLGQILGTARDLISVYRAVFEFVRTSMSCSAFFISFYDAKESLRVAAYAWGEGEEVNIENLPPMPITDAGGANSQAILSKKTVITNHYWEMMKSRPHVVLHENGVDPNSSLVVPMIIKNEVIGTLEVQAHENEAFNREQSVALEMVANLAAVAVENVRLLEVEAKAREIAEAANHAKDEFIALVSHELRSPLNAMLGWTRILQKQKTDEKTVEYALDVIVRNARAQSRLIEDLLDIARVGEGKLRLEMLPIELAPIINAAIEIIKPAAEAKKIHLNLSLDRAANFITGDKERLRQVIENLLSNAIKFTPDGGRVDVRLERENNLSNIVISDNGQGISAEFLPQIFERFRQADLSTTRRHGGLGIGLSLAQDLVELHGGTIVAESAGEEMGATFTVSFPARTVLPIKENSGKREDMDSQGKLSGFWILAVDDESDAREIVSFMLQINGAKVTTATSAVEALDILKKADGRLPDILLSDISMPNESGYALLEKIRSLPEESGGQIPAVALTAFNRPEDRQSAFDAGFQKHLGKPVEMDDLISAIIETANKG